MNSEIRAAKLEDLSAIHSLSIQLGYSPDLSTVQSGLEKMLSHPDYEVVVAEENGKVVGWMSLCMRFRIEDTPFLQVVGLITDETVRGKGFGRKLLAYAACKSIEQGVPFTGLYSSAHRKEAHQFYERSGFHKAKESYFFKKDS